MSFGKMLSIVTLFASSAAYANPANDVWHAKARQLLEQSVNIPTVEGRNRVPELAALLAAQYRAAGFPDADIKILPYDKTAALIVRWRAPSPVAKPIMLMAHMDVVEAKREDWSASDPFVFTEKDGYYYGRGTSDIKQGIAATTTAILKLKASGFQPKRDIIVFYTGDEETAGVGAAHGAVEWHDLLDVEYGLNADGGGAGLRTMAMPWDSLSRPRKRPMPVTRSLCATVAGTHRSRAPTMPSTRSPMRCTGLKPTDLRRS